MNRRAQDFHGSLERVNSQQDRAEQIELTVGVKQLDQAIDCLVKAGWSVQRRADGMLSVSARNSEDALRINNLLVDRRLEVFHLGLAQASLEDIFLTLTGSQTTARRAA